MTLERKHVRTSPTQLQASKEEEEEIITDGFNWRGIIISVLVIGVVFSIILLAVFLLTPGSSEEKFKGDRIQLNELIDGSLTPRRFNGSWVADDKLEFRNKDGHLVIYILRTKTTKLLVENTTFAEYEVEKYSISADHNYVLLVHERQKYYRYSFNSKYKIYNVENKTISILTHPDDAEGYLQYASWGPRDNQLVYVYENNVYYVPEVNGPHYPVSTNGIKNVIFNGVPDWLYAEEILKHDGTIWWAPDGNTFCYATINDTKVGTYFYNWFGHTNLNESENAYPDLMSLRYPKPGGDNPIPFLWVVDVKNAPSIVKRDVKPPREVQDQLVRVWDHYFTSVQWIDSQSLAVIWLARSQNFSVVTQCSAELWYCVVVYEQSPPSRKGWVDLNGPIFFGQNGTSWYMRLPLPELQHGHYKHVAVAYNDTRHVDYLTQGRFDIHKIVAYHARSNTVFFLSTVENRPGERHLYSVFGKKSRGVSYTKCLTCDEGPKCLYFDVKFSPQSEYYILECLGPGVPKIELRSIYNQTFGMIKKNNIDYL